MSLRSRLCAALIGAVAVLAIAPTAASAGGRTVELCQRHALLRDFPRGVVIGHLYRPQTLRLLRRDRTTRWVRVRTRVGAVGWLPPSALC